MGRPRILSLDTSVFNEPLTEEARYWIGFLLADGCISENTIILQLAEKDLEQIEKFKTFLKSGHKISSVSNGYGGVGYRFAVRSKELCNTLSLHGILPSKSFTATAPESLTTDRDFWRGVIDGDGSVGIVKSECKTYTKTYTYYYPVIQLCGSECVCTQFLSFCKSVDDKIGANVHKSKSIYALQIKGTAAAEVIRCLYDNAPVSLERKSNRAIPLMEDKNEIV
jgi:hypothetical protein